MQHLIALWWWMKYFCQYLLKSFEMNNAIDLGYLGLRTEMRAVVNLLMSSQVCNEIVF